MHEKIKEVLSKLGFQELTEIQKISYQDIYEGKDVLLISPTGTGKTLAALLPVFDKWLEEKPKPISILYITPLKSLNRDLVEKLTKIGNMLELEIVLRHGDTSAHIRKLQSEFPGDMFVITLETLQPLLTGKKLREHLKNVKVVILDEVHEIVDSKRGVQLALALQRLRLLAGNFQTVMLSATVGEPEKIVKFFNTKATIKRSKVVKRKEIIVSYPKPVAKDTEIAAKLMITKDAAARLRKVLELIEKSNSCIVFTNTREFAEILAKRIKEVSDISIGIHHSSLSKEVRIKNEQDFKKGKLKALIATSSLQLGIDIGTVDLVIQYLSPRQVTQLIQRIGRSGHKVTDVSKGIIICSDVEDVLESSAIAKFAIKNKLEKLRIHENALDVLAHQIAGFVLDLNQIEVTKLYEIVRGVWPYRNLSFDDFYAVCKELESLRIVRITEGKLAKGSRIFDYYFSNLSTIPDTKQYKVYNIIDNAYVGNLDEEFVRLHCEEGSSFILNGEAYRVVSVEDNKVLVEPSFAAEAVPSWEGELIPVPYFVAQEVGKLRKMLISDKANQDILAKEYRMDEEAIKQVSQFFKKQKSYATGHDDQIVIEKLEDGYVINCCFGSLVNETLAKFISSFLSAKFGTVEVRHDAYRIFIRNPKISEQDIIEAFSINPEHLKYYIQLSLENTNLFSWRFLHVAKRFGLIQQESQLTKSMLRRLIEEYRGTPVYKETIREIETEKMDIEQAERVLKQIKSGEIKIIISNKCSPLTKLAEQVMKFDITIPSEITTQILEVFKKRLLESEITLVCINCLMWERTYLVKEIPTHLRCGNCGSLLLACLKRNGKAYRIFKKVSKRKKLKEEEMKIWEHIKKSAELFLNYGKKACLVLAAKNVGPVTAVRILNQFYRDENEFYKTLLQKEIENIKARKFWKV